MISTPKHIRERLREEALSDRFQSISALQGATKRIGIPEPVFVDERLEVAPPPGDPITWGPLALWRRAVGRIKPEVPEPGGTVFCQNWADIDHAISALDWLKGALSSVTSLPTGVMEAELDNLKKAVLETGHSGDGHISPEGITNTEDIGASGMAAFAAWFHDVRRAAPKVSDWELDLSVVRGTAHGWPSYVSGSDPGTDVDLACHIWLAGGLSAFGGDILAFAAHIEERIGTLGAPVSAIMFSRSGPMAKPTPHFVLGARPDALVRMGYSTGVFSRERQVFAVPTFVNLFLRRSATVVKNVLRLSPSFKHTTGADFAAVLDTQPHLKFFSEDISGFDRSVTRRMQTDLLNMVYSPLMSEAERTAYDQLQDLPVLAPPLDTKTEAFLYQRSGMTISGSIFTTNDGTILNVASIGAAVAYALQVPESEIWGLKGARWDAYVLGDDCVIGMDQHDVLTRERYLKKRRASGFKTELFEGAVFLMNSVLPGRRGTPSTSVGVLARAVSKTFFREQPSRSILVDQLGLYVRWERCQGHPLFSEAWDRAVAGSPAGVSLGLSTFTALRERVNHPTFVRLLLKEAEQVAVRNSLRDLLTGVGHGDLLEGLSLSSASMSYFGGEFGKLFLSPNDGSLLSTALERAYAADESKWFKYLNLRTEGASVSEIVNNLPEFASLKQKHNLT